MKKIFMVLLLTLGLTSNSLAAGSSSSSSGSGDMDTKSNYDKAVKKIGLNNVALITGEEKILPKEAKYYFALLNQCLKTSA